jgi:D-serine deaminase-like pyridoxal phosphate-dependent protein
VPSVVAGGTPTFPVHAQREGVDLSPGTSVLWDGGYGTQLPDLDFLSAALVLTRVVSKPGDHRVCVDLGHKAIASEGPHPRVLLIQPETIDRPAKTSVLGAPILDATFVGHSEEHLVFESPAAPRLDVGDVVYGIPWHVCPTVALHSEAVVVANGHATDVWRISARERRLTI